MKKQILEKINMAQDILSNNAPVDWDELDIKSILFFYTHFYFIPVILNSAYSLYCPLLSSRK